VKVKRCKLTGHGYWEFVARMRYKEDNPLGVFWAKFYLVKMKRGKTTKMQFSRQCYLSKE